MKGHKFKQQKSNPMGGKMGKGSPGTPKKESQTSKKAHRRPVKKASKKRPM